MRTASHQSLKEGRVNPLAALSQTDRVAGKACCGDAEKEGNTTFIEGVAGLSKACDTPEEQPGGGARGLVIRDLPLIFLPQHVEALWEIVAVYDAAAASEEAATTAADVTAAEGASAEVPSPAPFVRPTRPASPTQTQPLRRQDTGGSRLPLSNASSESPAVLTARPPSPSEQHASPQRKHVLVAASGQRKNPAGQGREAHTAFRQTKSVNGGAIGSASRTAVAAAGNGLSNATSAAVAAPAGSAGGAGTTVPGLGKHSFRPAASGGAVIANLDSSPQTDICPEGEREKSFKPKGDAKALLRELICEQLSNAGSASAERQKAYTSAAVVELHVFSLLFAGTIGLCSKKAALYMSIIAAAVEDLQREKKLPNLSPLLQIEFLRKRIRRQTFDPFAKYATDSFPTTASTSRSNTAYPTFTRMEAQKLFHFATDTFVAHSRLYSYCMQYSRKQVANVNLLHTYIPVVPPRCAVPASSLTTIENDSEGSTAAPATDEGSATSQQERKRSGDAPAKPL